MPLPWHVALDNLASRRFGYGHGSALARAVGMPPSAMNLYLQGGRVPSIEQLQKILAALDADLADLQKEMDRAEGSGSV